MKRTICFIWFAFFFLTLVVGCESAGQTPEEHLKRAESFLDQGDYKAASIELKNVLRMAPKNTRARWLLGQLYIEIQDGAAAQKELARARELGVVDESVLPMLARALLLQQDYQGVLDLARLNGGGEEISPYLLSSRGMALLALDRKDEARQAFDLALAYDEMSTSTLVGMARLDASEGKMGEARSTLERVFKIDEHYWPAWSFQGDIERFEGNLEAAEAAYGKAIEYNPVDNTDLLNRALVRIAQKKFEQASEDIGQLTRQIKHHPHIDYVRGLLHFQKKEYEEAQTAFESVLAVENNYLPALLYLGAAHFQQGNQETAESYLDRYVGAIPDYLPASRMLAYIKLKKKGYTAAEKLIRNAVKEEGDMDSFTLTLLANALLAQNRVSEGIDYLQKVVAMQPQSAPARAELGLGLLKWGETEAGLAELEAAIELDPELQQAAARLIIIHLNNKEYEKALEVALANRDQQKDTTANLLLGVVYMARDETDNAAAAFQRALELDPGNTSATNGLAAIALKAKQLEKAKEYYRDALQHHPDDLKTLLNLATVEAAQGEEGAMKSTLLSAIASNPEAMRPRLILGRVYLKEGLPEKTLDLLAEMKRGHQENYQFLAIVADAELKTQDWTGAKDTLASIIVISPKNSVAHFQLAKVNSKLGDVEGYRSALYKTLELAPDHIAARIALSDLLLKEKNLADAEKEIQVLKQHAGDRTDLFVLEGRLAEMLGDSGKAAEKYQAAFDKTRTNFNLLRASKARWDMGNRAEAVKMLEAWMKEYPNDDLTRLELANRYTTLGQQPEAIEAYKKLLASTPNNVIALNNLSWLIQETDPAESLRLAKKASALAPQSVELMDTLAMALLNSGDVAQSLQVVEAAVASRPDNPTIRYHEAVILDRLGKSEKAATVLKEIIEQHDEFPEKKKAEELYRVIQVGNL